MTLQNKTHVELDVLRDDHMESLNALFAVGLDTSNPKWLESTSKVLDVIPSKVLSTNEVHLLIRFLHCGLFRYCSHTSRKAATDLIRAVIKSYGEGEKTVGVLATLLKETATTAQKIAMNPSVVSSYLVAFHWSCLLAMYGFDTKTATGNLWTTLVDIQSLLYSSCTGSTIPDCQTALAKKYSLKMIQYRDGLAEAYMKDMESRPQIQLHHLVLISSFYSHQSSHPVLEKHHKMLISNLSKLLTGTQEKLSSHLIRQCRPILQTVEHTDFTAVLLPSILKSLLRNPEGVLEAISVLLEALPIDLSEHVDDILKNILPHFQSSDDAVRDASLCVVHTLSLQCSHSEAIQYMLEKLLPLLNTAPSKEYRIVVLQSLKFLAESKIPQQAKQEMVKVVLSRLLSYMKSSLHKTTLICCIDTLSSWCKCGQETTVVMETVLKPVVDLFNSKTIPVEVRMSLLGFAADLVVQYHCSDKQLDQLITIALQSLDKAVAQPSQVSSVAEGVASARMFIKCSEKNQLPAATKSKMWNAVETLFVNPKFLMGAQDTELLLLMKLGESVFSQVDYVMPKASLMLWYNAVAVVLTHTKWCVRQSAREVVSLMVISSRDVLMEIIECLRDRISAIPHPEATSKENSSNIAVYLVEALLHVSSLAQDEEKEKIACDLFIACHHPTLVAVNQKLWKALLKRLKLNPVDIIANNSQTIFDLMCDNHSIPIISEISQLGAAWNTPQPSTTHLALTTVLSIHPSCIQPLIIDLLVATFTSPAVWQATKEDCEIMSTDPKQLYNPGLKKQLMSTLESVAPTNIRRSNRVYSYEEEKWDIEVKQEADRRQKQQLLQTSDILLLLHSGNVSKKLQELIEVELIKENDIRSNMLKLDQQLSFSTAILVASMEQVPQGHIKQLYRIIDAVIKSLKCPLSSVYACKLWPYVVRIAVPDENNAMLLAHVTLRLLDPVAMVNPKWCEEPLPIAVQRLIGILSATSLPTLGRPYHVDLWFSCCLPLIKAMIESSNTSNTDKIIQILVSVSGLHSSDSEFQHQLFPVVDTLKLLGSLIAADNSSVVVSQKTKLILSECCVKLCQTLSDEPLTDTVMSCVINWFSSTSDLMQFTSLKALGQWDTLPSYSNKFMLRMIVAANDTNDDIKAEALRLQAMWDLSFDSDELGDELVTALTDNGSAHLQKSCAAALGVWLKNKPDKCSTILKLLMTCYENRNKVIPVQTDSFGRVISKEIVVDYTNSKVGIAMGLSQLGPHLSNEELIKFFQFMLSDTLGDTNTTVRSSMIQAAVNAISTHQQISGICSSLMELFKTHLKTSEDNEALDATRHSAVILMGTLAQHLNKDDEEVEPIVHLLLETLDTPSQTIQEAIAKCLPPLVACIKPQAAATIENLLDKLFNAKAYGERKGAAYGLTAIVKGIGIPSLKQYNVMPRLQEAVQNKKSYQQREGALLVFELLCTMLGRLFEPYVVKILPDLLVCYGDGNQYVREAAENTASTIMANLSGHGVKMVLPSLLTALDEDQWRTKAGSAELLGTMAFCAPKQLSSCLPSIVPPLIEGLADSHSKVQTASTQALKKIGSVIKNPEVQALVPSLLAGLSDPNNQATPCLKQLLETEFVHVVDAPSLALIMPILERALQLRSTETKKMATQIIANMYSLTEPKELEPYMPAILPRLKQALVDPVPEVRSYAAKALGTMATGMESEALKELLSWLLTTLKSNTGSVDRAGAAQGLGEVLWSQGVDHLVNMMPNFISNIIDDTKAPHIRDGFLMLFIYLPSIFKEKFTSFIFEILPCILKGLSDEIEYIRDTALKAGQGIISQYADSAVENFLPRLLEGLLDDNWRIRLASVQLMGDLLYCLSGVSGKKTTESAEEDNFGTEEARKALIDILGLERRNRVLAGLYLARSDVSILVRQNALHIWKVIVTNTPRTLRDVLDILIDLLLSCLSSNGFDKRQAAAHSLGDLLRKLGERILPDILPLLETKMSSSDSLERQGVCFGVSELIQYSSHDNVSLHLESLVSIVLKALSDTDIEVRQSAASAFDALHSSVGSKILDSILPPLLNALNGEEDGRELALDALKQAMSVKSSVVLPYLIPKLTAPPVNARALALLSSVAGDSLHKHLPKIIPALIQSLEELTRDENEEAWTAAEAVVLSVIVDPGPALLMEELHKACKSQFPETRTTSMSLLLAMCEQSSLDLKELTPTMLPFLLHQLSDPEELVIEKAWLAMRAVIKRSEQAKELSRLVGCVHKCLSSIREERIDGSELPGFALKGIDPIVIMAKDGLFHGTPDEKEESARVIILLVHLSPVEVLSKCVLQLGGPLIRVYGDRHGWNIRLATLEALNELIKKVGRAARSFMPQLQTSYVKTLNDKQSLRNVRLLAVDGLKEIAPYVSRLDSLVTELHNGIKKNDDASVREILLQAISVIIDVVGGKVKVTVIDELKQTLLTLLQTSQEAVRTESSHCLGVLCPYMSDDSFSSVLQSCLLKVHGSTKDWSIVQAQAKALSYAICNDHLRIVKLDLQEDVASAVVGYASSDRVPVCVSGLHCVGMYVSKVSIDQTMLSLLFKMLSNTSSEVRSAACEAFGSIGQHSDVISDELLKDCIPSLLMMTKDKNTAVKASGEKAITDFLKLQQGKSVYNQALKVQDNATKVLLQECYGKTLQRQFSV